MVRTKKYGELTVTTFDTNDELISALTGLSLEEIEKRRKKIKEK